MSSQVTDPELLHAIQWRLEGLRPDATGRLERFKDMPGESGPPPRVVALDAHGMKRIYVAAGVDADAEARIRSLAFADVWAGHPELREALGLTPGESERNEYLTYTPGRRYPAGSDSLVQKLSSSDERLRHFSDGFFDSDYPAAFVVLEGDRVVAAAASSREDERAAEATVFASPKHRRRGLAGHVAGAWLHDVQDRDLIPFYSHVADNAASRELARSLGLTLRFRLATYP